MDAERAALMVAIEADEAAVRAGVTRGGPSPLFDSGLTMQQLRVLVILSTDGPVNHGDLAEILGVGLATVTGLVDRLVRRGFVEHTGDPHDRRVRHAALSAQGAELMQRITTAGQEARNRLLARIHVEDLRGLARGLAALRAAMDDLNVSEQDGPPPTNALL